MVYRLNAPRIISATFRLQTELSLFLMLDLRASPYSLDSDLYPDNACIQYSPPEGTGPHRYVFLAYLEPEEFAAPTTPAVGTGVALLK